MKEIHRSSLVPIVPRQDSPAVISVESPTERRDALLVPLPRASMGVSAVVSTSRSLLPFHRLERSRERNRIHARKTRQRKKEQMQNLQERAQELKQEQLALKQIINEKNTASILVGLFATSSKKGTSGESSAEDPRIEALLRRSAQDIPDASKVPELPSLILPGQHASRKARAEAQNRVLKESEVPTEDGIDYELLGKDRSKCTPQELDAIRKERNRMHAKRTRDRKRLFMEEMGEMCRQLEDENDLLLHHLRSIDPEFDHARLPKRRRLDSSSSDRGPALLSPKIIAGRLMMSSTQSVSSQPSLIPSSPPILPSNHLKALLSVAAGSLEEQSHPMTTAALPVSSTLPSVATAMTGASDSDSSSLSDEPDRRPGKSVWAV